MSYDPATNEMVVIASESHMSTVWDRYAAQKPQCKFGTEGICCKICHMGPCRITPKAPLGVCGADADTIVSPKSFARDCRRHRRPLGPRAACWCAHSRWWRKVRTTDYKISDPKRLHDAAKEFNIATADRTDLEIASDLADFFMAQFAWSEEPNVTLKLAPKKRQELWEKLEIAPSGIDSSVVELMHRTTMGVDHDYRHLIMGGLKCSLADGWVGSAIATTVSDILFGTPKPIRSRVNLGVLAEENVNIIVHGHEPTLSEMLAVASQDEELLAYARSKGAKGITIGGICCTANEVLMRHGLPVVGNFLQQELAIMTGAIETMVVDVQCVMPSLAHVVKCFHTELVSTSEIAQSMGAEQITFEPKHGYEQASQLIRKAIDNFERRDQVACSHSERVDGSGGRFFQRDDLQYAWRAFPQDLPPAERRHHRRPHSRRRRRCRLHQSKDPVQQRAREVDRGTDQAQRTGAFYRLLCRCLWSSLDY